MSIKAYLAELEEGRAKVRSIGLNFTSFKERVGSALTNPQNITEDEWVDHYNSFAHLLMVIKHPFTLQEYINETFRNYKYKTHKTELKK